jgi:hypothetical protein
VIPPAALSVKLRVLLHNRSVKPTNRLCTLHRVRVPQVES